MKTRPKPKPEFIGPVQPIWQRVKFPVENTPTSLWYLGDQWLAARHTLQKPYCWTPAKPFNWAGKQFIWGYPCIAFATKNFGFIVQRGPHGMIFARQ